MTPWPIPWPDEAHFADIALNLLHYGRLATDLFGGAIPGMGEHAYWTPPLYYLLLAIWFGVVAEGMWPQRALSLVCAVAALWAVWRLASPGTNPKIRALDRTVAMAAVAWCCVDVVFVRGALMGRMDMLCVALGLWAVVWAREALHWRAEFPHWQTRLMRSGPWFLRFHGLEALAGFAAGLAVCTHPLGAAAALAAFIWCPRWRFVAGAALPVGTWASWVLMGEPSMFVAQWSLQVARKTGEAYEAEAAWWRFLGQYQPMQVVPVVLWGLGLAGTATMGWRWMAWLALTGTAAMAGGEMWYPLYLVPVCAISAAKLASSRPMVATALVVVAVLSLHAMLHQVRTAPPYTSSVVAQAPDGYLWVNGVPDPYWELRDRATLRYPAPWAR